MNYYNEIKNEIYKKVKDYSKNRSDLNAYYSVGKLLSEAGKHYGKGIIKEYSKKISYDLNKKYSVRNLYNMRSYFEKICCNEILQPVTAILNWSHYCELLKINDDMEIHYYIDICNKYNYSKRELINKIKLKEYERLSKDTKLKIINKQKSNVVDLIKNPILIENKNKYNEISEKVLKQLILENIDNFLKELGNEFCYIGNEYKIRLSNRYNYINLLLFNIEFDCYVVVELKITELKKEHIGQIQIYMNYIDSNLKKLNQDKTIGIIICK